MHKKQLDLLVVAFAGWALWRSFSDRQKDTQTLGKGTAIAYLADKGNGPIIYEHEFEEPLPTLEINDGRDLELEGGGYEIYESWIVG